jgi:hypothetical protein
MRCKEGFGAYADGETLDLEMILLLGSFKKELLVVLDNRSTILMTNSPPPPSELSYVLDSSTVWCCIFCRLRMNKGQFDTSSMNEDGLGLFLPQTSVRTKFVIALVEWEKVGRTASATRRWRFALFATISPYSKSALL